MANENNPPPGWQLCKFNLDWCPRAEETKPLACRKGALLKMQSGADHVIGNSKIETALQLSALQGESASGEPTWIQGADGEREGPMGVT